SSPPRSQSTSLPRRSTARSTRPAPETRSGSPTSSRAQAVRSRSRPRGTPPRRRPRSSLRPRRAEPAGPAEPELAARDDDRAAADLDALDRAGTAVGRRVQLRGPPQLDPLQDLDLRPPLDEPVPAEVAYERTRCRPRRRVLGDAAARSEHA